MVRWEGYEPEWEWERLAKGGPGQAGDPLDTWEPSAALKGTLALTMWEEEE